MSVTMPLAGYVYGYDYGYIKSVDSTANVNSVKAQTPQQHHQPPQQLQTNAHFSAWLFEHIWSVALRVSGIEGLHQAC